MKKVLLIAAVALNIVATPVAATVEPHEALANVIKVIKCYQNDKKDIQVRFHNGRRYQQWANVRDVRRVSGTEFDFLVENKQSTGYTWIPAVNFSDTKCKEIK